MITRLTKHKIAHLISITKILWACMAIAIGMTVSAKNKRSRNWAMIEKEIPTLGKGTMQVDFHIRQAIIDDAEALARLRWDFSSPAQQAAQPFEAFREPFAAYLAEAFAHGWVVWVAEAGKRIIGNIYIQVVAKLPRPGRFGHRWGYVTNVYVIPDMRDAHIGAALMARVQQWAREEDLEFLLLWPSERAVPFYQRAGFEHEQNALIWELPARGARVPHQDDHAIHNAQSPSNDTQP
jgi:GNAT superfamily N-acetyltransferase